MSFNNNNNKSNDVIDYLIKKLESRLKGINKKKIFLITLQILKIFI